MDKKDYGEQLQMQDRVKGMSVSPAVIKRLPRYFRYLRELIRNGQMRISSSELSELMNVTASQIRQDLNCFGGFGQQGYGYNVKYLYSKISEILGVEENYRAVIIGAGHLGLALVGSPMFTKRGVTLTALFDTDSSLVGTEYNGLKILSVSELESYISENQINIAVLTLPRAYAKETAEKLKSIGIKGIWNFTNIELDFSDSDTVVQNVHIGDSLMQLTYRINSKNEENE